MVQQAPGDELRLLRGELEDLRLRLEVTERTISRLKDSAIIRSALTGAPAHPWPIVTKSPNSGEKYHLVRDVTTGLAHWIAGEPDKANWSDA